LSQQRSASYVLITQRNACTDKGFAHVRAIQWKGGAGYLVPPPAPTELLVGKYMLLEYINVGNKTRSHRCAAIFFLIILMPKIIKSLRGMGI
jgi:hypothetical protein